MIYLHKDDHNEIIMVNDGDLGVALHILTYVKKYRPGQDSQLEEVTIKRMDDTQVVSVRDKNGILKPGFKEEVKNAIKLLERKLIEMQQNRQAIQGAMKDYDRQ